MAFERAKSETFLRGRAIGSYRPVLSPLDGAPVGEAPWCERDEALECLEALAATWARSGRRASLPAWRRSEILEKAALSIERDAEKLALLIASEGGKPLKDARVEVARAADVTRLCAAAARGLAGREIPMAGTAAGAGRLALTTREPIGPVLAISAFNHPLNLAAHQVGPAVAMGCPVLIKPAAETPLSAFRYVGYLRDAGLPPELAQAILCEIPTAEALASSPSTAFLNFIGAARTGWRLRSLLAPGTRCALEHGGAAPVIVDASADLVRAASLVTKGGYYHSGQVCVSVQRVFVHKGAVQPFVEALEASVRSLKLGDAREPDVDCGPLIRGRDVERVESWVREAVASGADAIVGGTRRSASLFEPTLLFNPSLESKAMQEEIFGPVVCVKPYSSLDQALSWANGVRWAFQAAAFGRDLGFALACARGLEASAVMINDSPAFRVDWMPFHGLRESGLGDGGVEGSCRELTFEKTVVFRDEASIR